MEIGFTGTRYGMATAQHRAVGTVLNALLIDEDKIRRSATAHHGCCIGADEEFAGMCWAHYVRLIGHPPIVKSFESMRATRLCDELREPNSYQVRNQAIVDASDVMIATPRESQPQPVGGTWMTIRMALRALRSGKLTRLHVIGPDGAELDHGGWDA